MQTANFVRSRLDQMIDLKHPLSAWATRLPWSQPETELAPSWPRQSRDGEIDDGGKSFAESGGKLQAAGVSFAGRPRRSIRLPCSLVYLKYAFTLSDEALVERWSAAGWCFARHLPRKARRTEAGPWATPTPAVQAWRVRSNASASSSANLQGQLVRQSVSGGSRCWGTEQTVAPARAMARPLCAPQASCARRSA